MQQPAEEHVQSATPPAAPLPPLEELAAFIEAYKQGQHEIPSRHEDVAQPSTSLPAESVQQIAQRYTKRPKPTAADTHTQSEQQPQPTEAPKPLAPQPPAEATAEAASTDTTGLPQRVASAPPRRPRRSFAVQDLTRFPEIPDACIPTIERVEQFMRTELDVVPGSTILVACSGGIDSVVLLDILYILSFEHGYTLHVAHAHHHLRGEEADRDEAFVRSLAKQYDVPCHVTHFDTRAFAKQQQLSIEEAARELRYRFLRQMCGTLHAQYCAVAHTADDTAETLLLNLFRGTGLTGLAAIPPKRALTKKAQLIRPLLPLTREEIRRYAEARQLRWVEDSTNADVRYLRNRVRQLLPVLKENFNPRLVETLQRTAELLRQADGFIASLIDSTYATIATERDSCIELDRNQLAQLHPFLQGEIIERALMELTGGQPVAHDAVDRVRALITAEVGKRHTIAKGITALRDRESIVLSTEETLQRVYLPIFKLGTYSIGRYTIELEEVDRNQVRLGADPNVEYFDYDRVPYRLFLRTWEAGDRFAPLGMNGQEVLVADFLTNAKVSELERRSAVVLASATDILWVCGYRISDNYKLTNETRRILRATFRRT